MAPGAVQPRSAQCSLGYSLKAQWTTTWRRRRTRRKTGPFLDWGASLQKSSLESGISLIAIVFLFMVILIFSDNLVYKSFVSD